VRCVGHKHAGHSFGGSLGETREMIDVWTKKAPDAGGTTIIFKKEGSKAECCKLLTQLNPGLPWLHPPSSTARRSVCSSLFASPEVAPAFLQVQLAVSSILPCVEIVDSDTHDAIEAEIVSYPQVLARWKKMNVREARKSLNVRVSL